VRHPMILRSWLTILCLLPALLLADNGLRFQRFRGHELAGHVDEIVQLSHAIYREAPYFYDGSDAGYEQYLRSYGDLEESILCLAYDGENAIGLALGLPLISTRLSYIEPFDDSDPENLFYLGEFGLLPDYRSEEAELQLYREWELSVKEGGRFPYVVMWMLLTDSPFSERAGFIRTFYPAFVISWVHAGELEESDHFAEYWIKPVF
jgi:hypothetical protein